MFPVAPPVEGRDWLNSSPIEWARLRGHVVVVLFWSYGCEASLLAARQLAELAETWPKTGSGDSAGPVTVLAVHTPRFPYEDDVDGVRSAVARHRIELPVIHDPDYLTWNRYNPDGWPAIAVVNSAGRVAGITAGIGNIELVAEAVAVELARPHRRAGVIGGRDRSERAQTERTRKRPPTNKTAKEPGRGSSLLFPGGVAATESGTVVVADSGNDRILVGQLDNDLRTLRPKMEITDIDNPTAVACASDSVIYVTEAGSGSVLQVDLEFGTLDVLTDEETAMPAALLVDNDGSLVVADAGHDVLIRVVGGTDDDIMIGTIAGSGLPGCRDGAADQAELAQPVALARTENGIAFCDAASSNVRLLTDDGQVLTVTGNDFFDWGLVDGPAARARMQRPSGLCALDDGSLAIVDTGNNRIRLLRDRKISTFGLSGLNQPTAITALASGHLLLADTGNHRLVVVDRARKTGWPLAVYPASMTSVWDGAAPETR